ncbi:hypothetical protein EDB89DRAFT_1069946 [Lactarius sanguifluus]|nr:hypothetical protein EDB89DRAFT_1069946 [Lactarius sanguifluus]
MDTQSHSSFSSLTSAEPLLLTGSPSFRQFSSLSDPSSSATSLITQARRSKRKDGRAQGGGYRPATTVDRLPDNVLLEIFDFYRGRSYVNQHAYRNNFPDHAVWEWHLLVRVCRRWRQIVFESPHRLDLRILCTHRTPVKKSLGIWPAFPIVINFCSPGRSKRPLGQGNIIDALKHPDRICYVNLNVTGFQLGKMAAAMRTPFPVLTQFHVVSNDRDTPVLPARFLGGPAPRLQGITLSGIPCPALPTLLLSTSDLVTLDLVTFTQGDGCVFGRVAQAQIPVY